MSAPLDEARRLAALRERALAAADFPRTTCPASRHVRELGAALSDGFVPPVMEDDPAHAGADMLAVVAALWETRTELRVLLGRAVAPVAVAAALARLDAAVEALAAERDALRDRIARAVAELDAAPDADPEKPSKRAMREVLQANTRAWAVLMEGRDPPSRRRAGDAPRDAGEGRG